MDADVVIRAEGLGKKYLISHQAERTAYPTYGSLRDNIADGIKRWLGHPRDFAALEEFWALKDVDFEIRRGEVVGVIGRNGAGKSTLLKVLSRITEPSAGRVELRGRVASLLEVGTGFHPELSGRENIFLNGAILGMSRTEIQSKFDEIVAFAEIERFLDTPVKRYSSGMYVRLAFAVSAYLEPEILLVDEVLAVGDAVFQKKCLGRMRTVADSGRTVLFVSHNSQAVSALCERVIWLDKRTVAMDGKPGEVFEKYHDLGRGDDIAAQIQALPPDPLFCLRDFELSQSGQPVGDFVRADAPLKVRIAYDVRQEALGLRVLFQLCDDFDNVILASFHDENETELVPLAAGSYVSEAVIPAGLLAPIHYRLRVQAGIHHGRPVMPLDAISRVFRATAPPAGPAEYAGLEFPGKLAPAISWSTARGA